MHPVVERSVPGFFFCLISASATLWSRITLGWLWLYFSAPPDQSYDTAYAKISPTLLNLPTVMDWLLQAHSAPIRQKERKKMPRQQDQHMACAVGDEVHSPFGERLELLAGIFVPEAVRAVAPSGRKRPERVERNAADWINIGHIPMALERKVVSSRNSGSTGDT